MGRAPALVAASLLASAASSHATFALDIPANQWIQQPPPVVSLLPGRAGEFSPRGWNKMHYDPGSQRMILFDGYAELPVYVYENIFANSIWFYDVRANCLSLEKLDNWVLRDDTFVPLPENETDPTPFDRHVYSCSMFSASKNRFYMWAGANRTLPVDTAETWTYDFTVHAWRQMQGESPFTVFEQATCYDPYLEKMVLFSGAERPYGIGDKTWTFDLCTETWTEEFPNPSPSARMGQAMCFDTRRRLAWMFAGADWGSAGNELWTYDLAAAHWEAIPADSPWPSPRRFASLAYDPNRDLVLMWGGITASDQPLNDTWIFRPATRTWAELAPAASPSGSLKHYSEDLEYDPVNDVFVLHIGGVFWLYRILTPASAPVRGASAPEGVQFRVTSPNPSPDGAVFEFSLPRASAVSLTVFDAAGRSVDRLVEGTLAPGPHAARWERGSARRSSGLYIARLETPDAVFTRKVMLLH